MLAIFLLTAIVSLALAVSARRPDDPHASPEGAVRAFIAAAKRRDVDRMRAIAIAPERLERAIACGVDDRKVNIVEAVAAARVAMPERAATRVRLIFVMELSRRQVAVGDDYHHCRSVEPFEVRRMKASLVVEHHYGRGEHDEVVEALLLDGRWWLLIPTP